jgi:NAD(P)-dependent dehydrogenase (short-subunit alcohol dehydrogenase family)
MKPVDMTGKTVLVTGATSGIGRVTAETLAAWGARVLLVGRNPEKTARVMGEIRQRTGNWQVEALLADLSRVCEVGRLAREALACAPRLDVLVNNAGAYYQSRELTEDGYERTFALNHLAYFRLTNDLLERLKASAPSRVVNVSSAAHVIGRINFANLNGKYYNSLQAYANSKLANLLFTFELARRLEGTGVTVNAVHPGVVATAFGTNNPGLFGKMIRVAQRFSLTPEAGAQTLIYLAASPEVEGVSGRYFVNQRAAQAAPAAHNIALAQRLWQVSAELTGMEP